MMMQGLNLEAGLKHSSPLTPPCPVSPLPVCLGSRLPALLSRNLIHNVYKGLHCGPPSGPSRGWGYVYKSSSGQPRVADLPAGLDAESGSIPHLQIPWGLWLQPGPGGAPLSTSLFPSSAHAPACEETGRGQGKDML